MDCESAAKPFQLVAGNAALDLVNTLDFRFRESGAEELLTTYAEVLRFCVESGLLTAALARKLKRASDGEPARQQVLSATKRFREALAGVLYQLIAGRSPSAEDLAAVEGCFKQANAARALVSDEASLQWRWANSDDAHLPLWLLAAEAEKLLLSGERPRLRSCASDDCRWLFLDTSKNNTRRWCDMKICGNRMKARRHQARRAAG